MNQNLIFLPCFSLILLTGFVLSIMFKRRINCIKEGLINPTHYKTYDSGAKEPRVVVQTSRNFTNLHESPTIFYFLCTIALVMKVVDPITLGLAWAFFFLRLFHTAIHITSNKVNPRLISYALSWFVLMIMATKILINTMS